MYSIMYLAFFLCIGYASCGNILMGYELLSPSHQIWAYALAEGLMDKGHNVTMIGPFSDMRKRRDKYHPLVTEGLLEKLEKYEQFSFASDKWTSNVFQGIRNLMDYNWMVCNDTYHTNGFKTLLTYPKEFKFDLIILDVSLSPCFFPFIQRFGYPPTIGTTAFLLPSFLSDIFGNPLQPAYLPLFHTVYTDNMNFFQRVLNYIYVQTDIFLKNAYEWKKIGKLAKRAFGEDVATMESLQRHISLLLCNLNPAFTIPQPLTPNIIPVGGLHVRDARRLPKDLKTLMDNADNGVVLFALGTNVHSDHLSNRTKQALFEAFAKLKETVLWKFEAHLDNLPKNVVIRKWLPQNDILGHPNTKLFITHGGALSTYEAIYHGVPIIGMPFIVDQHLNINTMIEKNATLKLNFETLTTEEVFKSVNEVLTNPMYSNNIKKLSRRMRDEPQTPLERAVFWAEYAIRHNGAQFLTPKSRDMSLLVSTSTDVILFLLFMLISFFYLLRVIYKKINEYLKPKKGSNKYKLN